MDAPPDSRTVSLTVPGHPEYLVLARLALSAVCRLTSLKPADVADLKLAVTEAASGALDSHPAAADRAALTFNYRVEDRALVLEVRGPAPSEGDAAEWELGRAIIEATVDEYDDAGGVVRLVKYLDRPGA